MREKQIEQTSVKAMGGMMMDPYKNPANAIIYVAVQDYRKAKRVLSGYPYHCGDLQFEWKRLRYG